MPDSATVGADGSLFVGGCSLLDLAERFGTPLFVYDCAHIRARCREAVAAFGAGRVIYATKAFLCRAIARLVHEEGLRFDVASGGELHVVLAAGVPAGACVIHGNNKSDDELRQAIVAGVGRIVVDSFDELDRLDAIHGEGTPVPDVLLRVTPGVHAHTHTYIATGQNDSKFGFNLANGDAEQAARRAQRSASVNLVGFHSHIGSNVFVADSFAKAASVMAEFAADLRPSRARPRRRSWRCLCRRRVGAVDERVGRGRVGRLPRRRHHRDDQCRAGPRPRRRRGGHAVHGRDDQADRRRAHLRRRRRRDERQSAAGALRQRLRSDVAARPARRAAAAGRGIVGKHCESGDILIFEAHIPADTAVGDVLAVPVTGAYGHSMGSNYNKVPRPAIVFVDDGEARLVVRRETYDDLLLTDVG